MVRTGQEKQKITVNPSELEVSGDQVTFEIKAQVPDQLVGKKPVYSLNLLYYYGQKYSDPIGRLVFSPGEYVYENGLPTITRQISFPYSPQKPRGLLLAYPMASKGKNRSRKGSHIQLSSGIITTSKLVVKAN